jgi:hypothetical protein
MALFMRFKAVLLMADSRVVYYQIEGPDNRMYNEIPFQMKTLPAILIFLLAASPVSRAGEELLVRTGDWPRVFFFRNSEGFAANKNVAYERWEKCFSRLMGIEGKVLDEEVIGRQARNIDFFTRFKKAYPGQLVLLHLNGNARDPRYQAEAFFAGHWVYYNGAKILEDVPAAEGESIIRVSNPGLFYTNIGRYRTSNEDIGLCLVDEEGRPDWHQSEQVQLLEIDAKAKTLRVRRACYGTKARAFPKGSCAAAHVTEGPWGKRNNIMWYYNYSTCCPRDKAGRQCADVWVDDIAKRFAPGGELAAFDGLEFDVLHYHCGGMRKGRGPDCDADGKPDCGMIDGRNVYGIGVVEFCRKLRKKVGDGMILQADGHSTRAQRSFGLLNGIESEGWPSLSDHTISDWSGGMNRHYYWRHAARKPYFSYINHKYTVAGEQPGQRVRPKLPFSTHRLVFAAALFTDSAICYAFPPPKVKGELISVWDEFWCGEKKRLGWLGKPRGEAVRIAALKPNLLKANQAPSGKIIGKKGESEIRVRIANVPCYGPDLFVSLTASAAPMAGYPSEVARLVRVGIAPSPYILVNPRIPEAGYCYRGEAEAPLDRISGATMKYSARTVLGGEAKAAYLAHPPHKGGKGYTFWKRRVPVPEKAKLIFFTGMGEKSPARSDGVIFQVLAEQGDGGEYKKLFEARQIESKWIRREVDLKKFTGKKVVFKFVTDCGPKDHTATDHAFWAGAEITASGLGKVTKPVSFMTWAGAKPFTSGFAFGEVEGKTVDLEIAVEGPEPFRIEKITAHAHPDAMYREYERGLVLANPSTRPYTFDLGKLLPGRAFRRIRGTSLQDPKTNDGNDVGGKVTLGPKDALFLVGK